MSDDRGDGGQAWHVGPAADADLPLLAALMAASPLLQRYTTDRSGALAALCAAREAGDPLLAGRRAAGVPPEGLAWLVPTRILGGGAYLRLLLVGEGAQGAGLGSALLAAAEREGRLLGNHMYLLATWDNRGARRLYERHGYRHVGDLPGLVRPGLDEAMYHKPLRAHGERLPNP